MGNTVTIRLSDGNGKHRTVTLGWLSSLLGVIGISLSLFLGVARGVAWAGEKQMDGWFRDHALPKIEERMEEKLDRFNKDRELRLQAEVNRLGLQVNRLETLIEKLTDG